MKKGIRHVWCAAVLSATFALPSFASALTIQDILAMSRQGVSDDVLITVIQSASDLPEMTRDDYDALRKAGVSNKVASVLAARRKNAPVTPESPVTPEPAVVLENAVLAPVETSNAPLIFRKIFEEIYETFSVESEVSRRYAELQHATAQERASDAELPKVEAARAQIAQGNEVGGLETCLGLNEAFHPHLDTSLGAAVHQCVGLALEKMDAPAMAAVYLDRALQSASTIPEYSQTFLRFLDLARQTDFTSTAPERIAAHEGDISREARDAFTYFVAYSFVYGAHPDPARAQTMLESIPDTAPEYIRARILLATLAIRAPHFKFKTAAEYLNQALDALESCERGYCGELRDTAWLMLARIAFENHVYPAAHAFYQNVDVRSHHLHESMLEDAWGQVFDKQYASALALTHALRAPWFGKRWHPDLYLIEASAYLGLCRYARADEAVRRLRDTSIQDASVLRTYMASTPAREYYNQVIQHAAHPGTSSIPERIYHRVLANLTFRNLHRSIEFLTTEHQTLSRRVRADFVSLPRLQSMYEGEIASRQKLMSVVLGHIYESALNELHALDISASQVAIEIRLAERKREAECLKIAASGGQCVRETEERGPAPVVKADDEAFWRFDGEFWRDELRSYASGVTSLCAP